MERTGERTGLALVWGIRVVSPDGWSGKLRGVFIAPRAGRVSHILVQPGLFRKPRPASLEGATQREDDTLALAPGAGGSGPGRGSIRMTEKTRANMAGTSAPVQGFILHGRARDMRFLLVRYAKDIRAVPAAQVHNLTAGTPSVHLTPEEAARLPVYRGAADARRNAAAALLEADQPSGGFGDVEVQVAEGIARLSGYVHMPIERDEAEQAVRSSRGVLDVQNDLITDWDLRIKVAEALAKRGLFHAGAIKVRCRSGNVTLLGRLPSQALVEKAVAYALEVPGVRTVVQQMDVVPAAGFNHSAPATPSEASAPEAAPAQEA